MKKYTVIHKDGSKEIINAQCAVKDAIAEGNIVLDEDFDVVNPILLTPECNGKFAVIKENEPAKFIKYLAGQELGYEIDGNLYDPFGHSRPLPTERTTLSPDYRVKYVISERGTNYFSQYAVVDLRAYNKLRENLIKVIITGKTKNAKTNFKITT